MTTEESKKGKIAGFGRQRKVATSQGMWSSSRRWKGKEVGFLIEPTERKAALLRHCW